MQAPTQNTITATAYTGVLLDAGKTVTRSNAAASTHTIPAQATVAWAANTQLNILNIGAGTVTITPAAGVTINGTPLTLATSKGGSLVRTASNVWTFTPSGGGGKVLQVVSVFKADTFTSSSTTLVDVTGLSVTITPTSATSKIMVLANLPLDTGGLGYAVRGAILRDSTVVGGGTAAGVRPSISFWMRNSTSLDGNLPSTMTFIDEPATTSARTYKIQVAVQSGATLSVGFAYSDDRNESFGGRLASSIILMEIGA